MRLTLSEFAHSFQMKFRFALLFFIGTISSLSYVHAQNCSSGGDQTSYGNGSWIGYVYDHNGSGNPITNPFSSYKGYVTESEIFNRNWGTGRPSCAAGSNDFAVRYKMRKDFPCGTYTFTIGADDGVRLSFDGGASFPAGASRWAHNSYATINYTIDLNGVTDLVLEYYERSGDARVSFSYTVTNTTPIANAGPDQTISCGQYAQLGENGTFFFEDFENGLTNWSTSGATPNWYTANGVGSSYNSYQGSNCAILQVSSSNSYGRYLELNGFPSGSSRRISFYFINPSWSGDFDEGLLQYSIDGTNWITLVDIDGGYAYSSWQFRDYAIPDNAIKLRFYAQTYYGYGFAIDNVTIYSNYTYSWSPSTGLNAANVSNPTATPTNTQTYTLTVTNGSCTAQDQVTVTVIPLVITGNTSLCIGDVSNLDSPGEWNTMPSGGVISTIGNDKIHVFNSNDIFNSPITTDARVLVVGGGGGGGANGGGGGGAGGFYHGSITINAGTATAVQIGAGGVGHNNSSTANTAATNGGESSFGTFIKAGGGGGGASRDEGVGGQAGILPSGATIANIQGSGGGGGGSETTGRRAQGSGTYSGGTGYGGSCNSTGGGGGGAGSAGSNGAYQNGGNGGNGIQNDITGTLLSYAGGGGGGITCGGTNVGTSGSGIGGSGGSWDVTSTPGAVNTGSGGGGGGGSQQGGLGVVIIRYTTPQWTSSNPAVASVHPNTGVVTANATGTASITFTNQFGCFVSTNVTVSSASSATITSSNTSICHGNAVTIGGAVTATGNWSLALSNGAIVTGTGSGSWSTTVTPATTTTYSLTSLSGQTCSSGLTGSVTVTLPATGISLANNGESATCVVNAGETVRFYHSSGRYIASVTAGATGLGSTVATVYDEGTPLMTYADCQTTGLETAVLERHWVITPSFNAAATVALPYYESEFNALAGAAAISNSGYDNIAAGAYGSLGLSKYSGPVNIDHLWNNNCPPPYSNGNGGTTWQTPALNGTLSSVIPGWPANTDRYSSFSISGFSEFWLHASNSLVTPLAVNLSDFSAECNGKTAHIRWVTLSEQNNDYFVLESSRDGESWHVVETVSGTGALNSHSSYEITDPVSISGYYRLKQVDFDGAIETFGPIAVNCENKTNELTVYPNPNNGTFTVAVSTAEAMGESTIIVQDLNGKITASRELNVLSGTNTVHFEGEHLVKGTYIVSIKGVNNLFIPVKLIIQ